MNFVEYRAVSLSIYTVGLVFFWYGGYQMPLEMMEFQKESHQKIQQMYDECMMGRYSKLPDHTRTVSDTQVGAIAQLGERLNGI